MKHDFADDLRGPDPTGRLHRAVMIALAAAIALLAAFIFTCFAWAAS